MGELAAGEAGGECLSRAAARRSRRSQDVQAPGAGSPPDAGEQAALPASVHVATAELALWPASQSIAPLPAPLMAITTFGDHTDYHPAPIAAALAAENDPRFRGEMFRGACGTKVRKVSAWTDSSAMPGRAA